MEPIASCIYADPIKVRESRKMFISSHGVSLMKSEYHEGVKAGENFNALATAVFRAKKTTVPPKAKPTKKAARRKASGKDKA